MYCVFICPSVTSSSRLFVLARFHSLIYFSRYEAFPEGLLHICWVRTITLPLCVTPVTSLSSQLHLILVTFVPRFINCRTVVSLCVHCAHFHLNTQGGQCNHNHTDYIESIMFSVLGKTNKQYHPKTKTQHMSPTYSNMKISDLLFLNKYSASDKTTTSNCSLTSCAMALTITI